MVKEFLKIMREIAPPPAVLHEPVFEGNEKKYLNECIDTGWVSSVGKFVDRMEGMLQEITGAKRAVVVSNGTAALFSCLYAAGVKRDDEVLIPALTFVATANAVVQLGAVPHFVDSNEASLGMDPKSLETYLEKTTEVKKGECFNIATKRRIKALVPVHILGHPCQMDELLKIAKRFGLECIEDATEALGSIYKGRRAGTLAPSACLSFNGNKTVTTGGGGAVLVQDEALGKRIKHLTNTAKLTHPWEFVHDEVGFNLRLPNINAALGCAQLELFPKFLETKRALAEKYNKAFKGSPYFQFIEEPPETKSAYWLCSIRLRESSFRDEILKASHEAGYLIRPLWKLMPQLAPFKTCPQAIHPTATALQASVLSLPSGVGFARRALQGK